MKKERDMMKKVLSLVVLLGLGMAVYAQDYKEVKRTKHNEKRERVQEKKEHKSPEEIAKIRTERLDKELKFTESQREQIYAIQLDQSKRQAEFSSKMRDLRKEQRAVMKETKEKFADTLTSEQQAQLKEKFAHVKRNKHMNKRGNFKMRKEHSPQQKGTIDKDNNDA